MVRAILQRKSGMSIAEDDARHDNIDAIELYHEILARVWERLSSVDDACDVRDIKAYAATVSHNAWSDYLRDKYPRRASLKNRLRYFFGHQARYAVWTGTDGKLLAGYRAWQLGAAPAATPRITALREGREGLPTGAVPRKPLEQCNASDWDALFRPLLDRLCGPTTLDDLVAITARLIGLKEERIESLTQDDDDEPTHEMADVDGSRPDRDHEMRSTLVELWAAIVRLKPDYRCAYLLNIPGPGKSRGDIEVFVLHGIASIGEIGTLLALNDSQFQTVWDGVEVDPADRAELAIPQSPNAQFYLLWKYLPLADALIAKLLGLAQQQVINRRMLALRELARALGAEKR